MSETSEAASCAHCGLPLPIDKKPKPRSSELRPDWDVPRYCCLGCRFAASLVYSPDGEDKLAAETCTRLGLGIFFAMNVMVFTMALWTQDVYGQFSQSSAIALQDLFRYLALIFTLPVLFLLGTPLFEEAILAVRQRRISTDLLLAVGVVAAFVYSAVAVASDDGHVYFEVVCMILVAVTLGRWMEATGKVRTTDALRSLQRLLPDQVRLVQGDNERLIPLEELEVGQRIRVAAGQRIAVDGTIVAGGAAVDQQVVTGESQPVEISINDSVLAGSLNLDGDLTVHVACRPGESTIDQLVATVTDAARNKDRWGRISDRIASWFFPFVALTAIATFVVHVWLGQVAEGLMAGLAVTVVACPCALALAAPLAIWNAFGQAARRGIIIRSADAMSRMAAVRQFCFDKTGTLTTGQPQVDQVIWDPNCQQPNEQIHAVAVALARASTHPTSLAIQRAPVAVQGTYEVSQLRAVSGRGLIASLAGVHDTVVLGSLAWMQQQGQAVSTLLTTSIDNLRKSGQSVTYVAWSGQVKAAYLLKEELRPEAKDVIRSLQKRGDQVVVLTGDDAQRGATLGRHLGVTVLAEQLPEDKLEQVRKLQKTGCVAMVGDGINDAPALAVADVGIAMGCGADVTRHTADVCLLGNDLHQLVDFEQISADAVKTIRWNLTWSLAYNVIAIPIAAIGWLNPIVAAIAMAVSSAMVVSSSLKLSEDDRSEASSPVVSWPSEGAADGPTSTQAAEPQVEGVTA